MVATDPYGTRAELLPGVSYHRLDALAERGIGDVSRLPVTLKILLENSVRNSSAPSVREGDVEAIARWDGTGSAVDRERAFMPARVLLQDFTGVPAVVDLAAMRAAVARAGGDPMRIDPLVPVDLVVDHSVQVDAFGNREAYERNIAREYERNRERYSLLRWAQQAFQGFRVVPPGMGIVHQINLEYLAQVVQVRDIDGVRTALPDTVVGTDSHTPMVNGVGVLGWGVGGIEAEACMLGQPLFLLAPVVVGVRFHNALPAGTTATDLVLTLTELLRKHGVVNKFVEFCGSGLTSMSVPDRATLSNMSPEFGATASLFPVDARTLEYLRGSGRDAEHIDLVERYSKEQGMFRTDDSEIPTFSEMVELDLASVVPSVAGPKRPQDRVALPRVWESFCNVWAQPPRGDNGVTAEGEISREEEEGGIDPAGMVEVTTPNGPADAALVRDGSIVIAAITSCTNTSNPAVMVAAGLLARNAVARGLMPPDYVKTSLAPGSRVVTDYLERAGLLGSLEQLRFNLVGYGCTTCIGNSGPLPELVAERIDSKDLTVAAVLSGNRNFEGRIHPQVRAAYLASPPLVVAYALAGRLDIDLTTESLGIGHDGTPVFLNDIWPSADEVTETVRAAIGSDLYTREYERIFDGDEHWQQLPSPTGALFDWDAESTYVREPPYFIGMSSEPKAPADLIDARVLAVFGELAHHRPHLAGRQHLRHESGCRIPSRARRRGARLQHVRCAARQPRCDGSRHLREHPHPQSARRRQGGRVDGSSPRRCRHDHLRGVGPLSGRRHPAHRHRRPRVRHRVVTRLGRERPAAPGSSRCDRAVVRAHSPRQSRGHGHSAAAVPRRRERRVTRSRWHRAVHDSRRRECRSGINCACERTSRGTGRHRVRYRVPSRQ